MKYWISLLLFLCSCNTSSDPVLHIFTFSDYILPALIEQFEKQYHCRVVIDTYDTNESMYAKLKLGGSNYDLLVPSNYYLEVMQQQKMVQPLDSEKLPNLKNLDPTYLKLMGHSQFGIPYLVSTTGIAYRRDRVENFEPSWNIFSKKSLKGRMTLLNDVREVLGAALIYLGYSVNTKNREEIEKATQLVIEWKQNIAKFESEQYKNGIASGEFLVVQGYSGDILQTIQENPQIAFIYPKEGALLTIDYLAISQDVKQLDLAYQFINYLLEPKVAAANMEFTRYLAPNQAAYPLLSDELRTNSTLFPSQETVEKLQPIRYVSEATPLYNQAWDKIKSAD